MSTGSPVRRSYLVCATPRSGSTLVCKALAATGVAGVPDEYYEALLHSGRPRRPDEYFTGVADRSILDHLAQRRVGEEERPVSRHWSRSAYDRYVEWTLEAGTTDNGVFGAKLMWGYFGDFVSLLRNVPRWSEVPLTELLPSVFPDLRLVRVVRANKLRQAVSLWKAVQTASWRTDAAATSGPEAPPYRAYLHEQRPQLRFHYGAISHLLEQILREEAAWDAFFEHVAVKPTLVLYENFAADPTRSTLHLLERLQIEAPEDLDLSPPTRPQSDDVNDDWVGRYGELRLGTEFDLVPVRASVA
jgi:trehalose 2-sulfotransferase